MPKTQSSPAMKSWYENWLNNCQLIFCTAQNKLIKKALFNQGLALTLFFLGFAGRYTMMEIKSILVGVEKV